MAKKLTQDEKDELAADRSYKLGQSVGLEEAASYLMEQATVMFRNKKDDTAELLRLYADELQKRSDERHPNEQVRKERAASRGSR